MLLRQMNPNDYSKILAVAEKLSQWFTPNGLALLQKDIHFQSGIVVEDKTQIVGFLIYFVNQGIATISWMGVLPSQHRKGIGTKLITELRKILLASNVESIMVSTLGESIDYEPYQQTRSFYRKNDFKDFQKIPHPNNPEQEEELILRAEI